MKTLKLKKGREASLLNKHPWIFSKAIDDSKDSLDTLQFVESGEIVKLNDHQGKFLALTFVHPGRDLLARVISFSDEPIDSSFFVKRIESAIALRDRLKSKDTNSYRLINSDGDSLSGLVVDDYAGHLVMQIQTVGMEKYRSFLLDAFQRLKYGKSLLEKSDGMARNAEGLRERIESIIGETPEQIEILENNMRFFVHPRVGQKTGFYLDQRDNRHRVNRMPPSHEVLNTFSYSGGFSLSAALTGARTTSVDSSENALNFAKENFKLNSLESSNHEFIKSDVFDFLKQDQKKYDLVILDPPGLIKSRSSTQKGFQSYLSLHELGFGRVRENGLLLTCSCSQLLTWDMFQKAIFLAAKRTRVSLQVLGRYGQPFDHPYQVYHPEGEYLKTFLLRVSPGFSFTP